jgi:acyl-homoserine-lactone acylase
MRSLVLPLSLLLIAAAPPPEIASWRAQAAKVTITRDNFGIAHISGMTDADAVFGMIYAQAEDDFPRIEANYLTALGRTAEADGEGAIWKDLRARLYVSDAELKADYAKSPAWLKKLMDGWAAGLNYYLATHPQVKPRVLTRFEPWMALSFTEGSIGGDIEKIDLKALEQFYSPRRAELGSAPMASPGLPGRSEDPGDLDRRGSNGIAIAPGLTRDGRPLLLINPHTSFFFRSEQQVSSAEGLNAYGAATWGQFFIYQGFNRNAGWMHTSSGVDNIDEFVETIEHRNGKRNYRYGQLWRDVGSRLVTIRYRKRDGSYGLERFTTYRTHHGPIVRAEGGKWIAIEMMYRPVEALEQSYLRTKATDLGSFLDIARLRANSSNNTIFADSKGAIAYLHAQFVPRRNDRFDYTRPVDGSDPATDWTSLHNIVDLPNVISPPNGWVQNTNNWPYSSAGAFSPKPQQYPRYMDMFGENYRGIHAVKLLEHSRGWTLDSFQAAAFDSFQPGFAALIPPLVEAYRALPGGDSRRPRLAEAVGMLERWDYRWSAQSEAQSLAVFWADELLKILAASSSAPKNITMLRLARDTTADQKIAALEQAVARLQRDFGSWKTPWGEINRFQRISPAIDHPFSDDAPSIAIPFAYGNYGSLASSSAAPRNGSKRWYGTSGNSFVAVVELGPRVRAKAVSAGGESGDPASPHFNDQAARYAAGDLRPVYFYPEDLQGHIERSYRPGE